MFCDVLCYFSNFCYPRSNYVSPFQLSVPCCCILPLPRSDSSFTAEVVVAGVPFVDVAVSMSDASIPLTAGEWEEWGSRSGAYDRVAAVHV